MLDNEKFEVTIQEDDLDCLKDTLRLYEKIHCSSSAKFSIKANTPEVLHIRECYGKEEDAYPLDVLLPMIRYRVEGLHQTQEGYYDGDGDNYKAVKVWMDSHGIKIKRVFVYAGK